MHISTEFVTHPHIIFTFICIVLPGCFPIFPMQSLLNCTRGFPLTLSITKTIKAAVHPLKGNGRHSQWICLILHLHQRQQLLVPLFLSPPQLSASCSGVFTVAHGTVLKLLDRFAVQSFQIDRDCDNTKLHTKGAS